MASHVRRLFRCRRMGRLAPGNGWPDPRPMGRRAARTRRIMFQKNPNMSTIAPGREPTWRSSVMEGGAGAGKGATSGEKSNQQLRSGLRWFVNAANETQPRVKPRVTALPVKLLRPRHCFTFFIQGCSLCKRPPKEKNKSTQSSVGEILVP